MNAPHFSDRSQIPPPLPSVERRRIRTESSATAGWAARLAELFPDSTVEHLLPQKPSAKSD